MWVDSINGDDMNDGLSANFPKQNLNSIFVSLANGDAGIPPHTIYALGMMGNPLEAYILDDAGSPRAISITFDLTIIGNNNDGSQTVIDCNGPSDGGFLLSNDVPVQFENILFRNADFFVFSTALASEDFPTHNISFINCKFSRNTAKPPDSSLPNGILEFSQGGTVFIVDCLFEQNFGNLTAEISFSSGSSIDSTIYIINSTFSDFEGTSYSNSLYLMGRVSAFVSNTGFINSISNGITAVMIQGTQHLNIQNSFMFGIRFSPLFIPSPASNLLLIIQQSQFSSNLAPISISAPFLISDSLFDHFQNFGVCFSISGDDDANRPPTNSFSNVNCSNCPVEIQNLGSSLSIINSRFELSVNMTCLTVIETDLSIVNSNFEECHTLQNEEKKEGGGGLLIQSDYPHLIQLENVFFQSCTANNGFGGGVNIHLNHSLSFVNISNLNFYHCATFELNSGGGGLNIETNGDVELNSISALNCSANNNGTGGGINVHARGSDSLININHGEFIDCSSAKEGGSIFVYANRDIHVSDVNISNSFALLGSGGGMKLTSISGDVWMENANFWNCSTRGSGTNSNNGGGAMVSTTSGGIFLSFLSFEGCSSTSKGGALYLQSHDSLMLTDIACFGCQAFRGGAIYLSTDIGNATVRKINCEKSQSTSDAGAIWIDSTSAAITIDDLTISNSQSINGSAGCLRVTSFQSISLMNSIFFNCHSAQRAGAILGYSSANVTLMNIAIRNSSSIFSGAIAVDGAGQGLYAEKLDIADCSAQLSGGGLSVNLASKIHLRSSSFRNCFADGFGGGVFLSTDPDTNFLGAIVVDGVSFSQCGSISTDGGALFATSNAGGVIIQNTQIEGCLGSRGAGIYISNSSSAIVENTTFVGCHSLNEGGGLVVEETPQLEIFRCNFESCSSIQSGGAVSMMSPHSGMSQTVITKSNSITFCSSEFGGGFSLIAPSSNFTFTDESSIFIQNQAKNGGAFFIEGSSISTTMQFSNISLNVANSSGGGIFLNSSIPATLSDVQFICNSALNGSDIYLTPNTPLFIESNVIFMNCTVITPTTTTILTTSTIPTTSTIDSTTTSIASTTTSIASTTTTISTTTTTTNSSCESNQDVDHDGYPDCIDLCPFEPTLFAPSTCDCYPIQNCQNCLLAPNSSSCPPLIFHDNPNATHPIQVGFGNDTTITVGFQNNSYSLNFSWGSIREVDAKSLKTIKGINVSEVGWIRYIFATPTLIQATFSTFILPNKNFPFPLNITLFTEFIRNPYEVASRNLSHPSFNTSSSLKLSLEIDGNWAFLSRENELYVDFTFDGSFEENGCQNSYFTSSSNDQQTQQFDLFGNNHTKLRISFLRYCFYDNTQGNVVIRNPVVTDNIASFLLQYPSFNSSLFYDPSFALLLGDLDGSCENPLFVWILPSAFLLGALVISVFICILGSLPFAQKFVKGVEGYRIYKLRKIEIPESISNPTAQEDWSNISQS